MQKGALFKAASFFFHLKNLNNVKIEILRRSKLIESLLIL